MEQGLDDSGIASVDDVVDPRYRTLDVDAPTAQRVRAELDRDGVSRVEGFLRPSALLALQHHIRTLARDEEHDGRMRLVKGYIPDPIRRLASSDLLVAFVNLVLGDGTGAPSHLCAPVRVDDLSAGINIMRRAGDAKPFHFDGTYLNVMLPVLVSESTQPRRGQLTIYPNIRTFNRTIVDRFVVSPVARLPLRRVLRSRTVDYVPGELCFFYGYRTLHGVAPLDDAGLRCVFAIKVNIPTAAR
jgi:hypothetical protein